MTLRESTITRLATLARYISSREIHCSPMRRPISGSEASTTCSGASCRMALWQPKPSPTRSSARTLALPRGGRMRSVTVCRMQSCLGSPPSRPRMHDTRLHATLLQGSHGWHPRPDRGSRAALRLIRLAYRQTEGLIGSVIGLLGLDLAVPDHTTLCRRAETLEVPRPKPRGDGAG